MTDEDSVFDHVEHGRFTEAVSAWRHFAVSKGYFGGSSDTSWCLSARLLEARLIYLSMFKHDEVFQAYVDGYRAWLLEQTAQIATSSELSMERFALPDSMLVGHPVIDRDHKILFSRANDIRNALRLEDRVRATQLADGLIDEIIRHFEREEKVLLEEGYPDAVTHAQYHGLLIAKAEDVRKVLFGLLGDGSQSVVTFDMLISFLVNDPIAADMDFKAFFQGRRAEPSADTENAAPLQSTLQTAIGTA